MAASLMSGTRILSDMLLLRLCGYTSNSEEILIKTLFNRYNRLNDVINDVKLRQYVNTAS